jgi:hypothetical protein
MPKTELEHLTIEQIKIEQLTKCKHGRAQYALGMFRSASGHFKVRFHLHSAYDELYSWTGSLTFHYVALKVTTFFP